MERTRRYVALLRGINVGGHNVIRMAALKAAFETMGFLDVETHIQSGNVLFGATGRAGARLESEIESGLSKRFRYDSCVLVRSRAQLRGVVAGAPADWPRGDARCNVVFLKAPLAAPRAMKETPAKPGVDTVKAGVGALYYGTLKSALSRSALPKIVGKPVYKSMTIRTFGTVVNILERMGEEGAA